jgi:hypothetical protein
VDNEVAALDLKRVERVAHPASEPAPRVVELLGPLGETESREVERHGAESVGSERRDDLAVEVGAGRNAVDEDDRGPGALIEGEALDAGGLELSPCGAMGRDQLGYRHRGGDYPRTTAG